MANKYTKKTEKNFILVVTIILLMTTFYLIKDIFSLIVYSLILCYFLYPLYEYFYKKFENKRVASLLTISTSILFLFIPLGLLSYFLILNLIKLVVQYSVYLENPDILNTQVEKIVSEFTNSTLFANVDFSIIVNKLVVIVVDISRNFFSSIPKYLAYFFIIIFITYYVLIYNKEILRSLNEYLPLSLQKQNALIEKIAKNIKVLFKGYFLTGIIQTGVALIGYLVFGAPEILIITFLTLLTSLIPYLGTPLVWVPVSIYMIISGNQFGGIALLIYGTLIINLVDNFLRPVFMSDKDTIPPALVFIGFVGGLFAFGIVGIILGPLIISITAIFLKYLVEHYENNE